MQPMLQTLHDLISLFITMNGPAGRTRISDFQRNSTYTRRFQQFFHPKNTNGYTNTRVNMVMYKNIKTSNGLTVNAAPWRKFGVEVINSHFARACLPQ